MSLFRLQCIPGTADAALESECFNIYWGARHVPFVHNVAACTYKFVNLTRLPKHCTPTWASRAVAICWDITGSHRKTVNCGGTIVEIGCGLVMALPVSAAQRYGWSQPNPKQSFKMVVIGDAGVGKTSLLLRHIEQRYVPDYCMTIGTDYCQSIMHVPGPGSMSTPVRLRIWDCAGFETYRALCASYFRGVQGVFLVFDVTNRASFAHLDDWLVLLANYTETQSSDDLSDLVDSTSSRSQQQREPIVCIIGHKIDRPSQMRQVSEAEAKAWAEQHACSYYECSAKQNQGVAAAFQHLAEAMAHKFYFPYSATSATTTTATQSFQLDHGDSRHGASGSRWWCGTCAQ